VSDESHRELPSEDAYDVVVVGGGMGGLGAGACLAKGGQKVLVVDRLDGPGGLAHAFRRDGLVFDPAVHVTTGFEDDEIGDALLRALGVRDRVEFAEVEEFYGASYPDARFVAPRGLVGMIEAHSRVLPEHAREIESFFRLCDRVYTESRQMGFRVALTDMDELIRQFPTFFTYRNAVAGDVVRDQLSDPRAGSLCLTCWPYMGVPPEKLPLTQLTAYLIGCGKNPLYCLGGFQKLADAVAGAITDNGGELVFNTTVTDITVEDGRAVGVVLEGGHEVRAQAVVSNVDGRQTFDELIGREHVTDRALRRLDRLEPSISAFIVYSATSLDLSQFELGHETFVHRRWDHSQSYRDARAGIPGGIWITTPSALDPSLAPPGVSIVTITSLMAYDIGEDWEQARSRYTELLLDEAERVIPGLRDHLVHVESATPRSIEAFTRAQRGAIYGWDLTLQQLLTKRLRQETPIGGLYLAGHWTEHGAACLRVLLSGAGAAQKILGYPHLGALLEGLSSQPP
jgi:phytoene dehydrogenase-like protein